MAASKKTIKVLAEYPFCDVDEGQVQTLWGVDFTHEVVKQDGKDFHILVAELDAEQANAMFESGRVTKA